ncbi:hypothetical protein [Cytobacillus oceanisediminis]|nr:hypothetical protein [Cytobacillus oceanisediminis]
MNSGQESPNPVQLQTGEEEIRRKESELMQQPLKKKDFGMDSKVS